MGHDNVPAKRKRFSKVRTCIGPCGKEFVAHSDGQWVCHSCQRRRLDDGSFLERPARDEQPAHMDLVLWEVTNGEVGEISYWRVVVIAQDSEDAVRIARPLFLAAHLAAASVRARPCLLCRSGLCSELSDTGIKVPRQSAGDVDHVWRRYVGPEAKP